MTRLPLACLAVSLAGALAVGGCTTDTTANVVDANATGPSDAGTATLAQTDAPDFDAGVPPDAGSMEPDAGLIPIANTASTDKPVRPDLPTADGRSTPFDRILAKPKTQGGDIEAIKAAVEKKTGHKLTLVRKTAGKWLLLQFAPTTKGRDADDQKKLVDVLKSMEELASVEGDRLMKVKQP